MYPDTAQSIHTHTPRCTYQPDTELMGMVGHTTHTHGNVGKSALLHLLTHGELNLHA